MNGQLPIISQAALPSTTKSTYPANHLQTLLDGFCDLSGVENAELTFKGLSLNSNKVHEEFLFLACAGVGNASQHGIAYAGQAINKGASCVAWEPTEELQDMPETCVVEGKPDVPVIRVESLLEKSGEIAARFYQHPSRILNVIGITGTNGKTSTAHFIARMMQQINEQKTETEHQCAIIGTLGNGLYGQLQQTTHTTPDAISLQQLLAEYRDQNINTVVMEVSSHALSQGRVNGIEFDVAVLTNLSRDHLDYHGDMQNYAEEKLKLFLKPGLKTVILNKDDAFAEQIINALKQNSEQQNNFNQNKNQSKPDIVTYAQQDKKADYSISDIKADSNGIRFNLHTKEQVYLLETPLIGHFNIDNILAAIAVLETRGYELLAIIKAARNLRTVAGRMEKIVLNTSIDNQPLVVIDYAHTPDALEKALQAVKAHTTGKVFCVFGCGGDRDQGKRLLMAQAAESYADQIMVTSDNPRSEDPQQIIKDIMDGFNKPQAVWMEVDRVNAIAQVLSQAQTQDCVLIAGKGHEDYQEIKGQKISFSDKACVQQFYSPGQKNGANA